MRLFETQQNVIASWMAILFCRIAVSASWQKNHWFGKKSVNFIEFGTRVSRTGGFCRIRQTWRPNVHFRNFRPDLGGLVAFLGVPPNFGSLEKIPGANLLLFSGAQGPHPVFVVAARCTHHSQIGGFRGFRGNFGEFRGSSGNFGGFRGISGRASFGGFWAFWCDFSPKFSFWRENFKNEPTYSHL